MINEFEQAFYKRYYKHDVPTAPTAAEKAETIKTNAVLLTLRSATKCDNVLQWTYEGQRQTICFLSSKGEYLVATLTRKESSRPRSLDFFLSLQLTKDVNDAHTACLQCACSEVSMNGLAMQGSGCQLGVRDILTLTTTAGEPVMLMVDTGAGYETVVSAFLKPSPPVVSSSPFVISEASGREEYFNLLVNRVAGLEHRIQLFCADRKIKPPQGGAAPCNEDPKQVQVLLAIDRCLELLDVMDKGVPSKKPSLGQQGVQTDNISIADLIEFPRVGQQQQQRRATPLRRVVNQTESVAFPTLVSSSTKDSADSNDASSLSLSAQLIATLHELWLSESKNVSLLATVDDLCERLHAPGERTLQPSGVLLSRNDIPHIFDKLEAEQRRSSELERRLNQRSHHVWQLEQQVRQLTGTVEQLTDAQRHKKDAAVIELEAMLAAPADALTPEKEGTLWNCIAQLLDCLERSDRKVMLLSSELASLKKQAEAIATAACPGNRSAHYSDVEHLAQEIATLRTEGGVEAVVAMQQAWKSLVNSLGRFT